MHFVYKMSGDNKRITEIDALRGFGIFMVVFGHSMTLLPVDTSQIFIIRYLHDIFWDFHMYLFFFIAGFCFKYSGYQKGMEFIKKKIVHLMIPYYVFNLIDVLPRAIFVDSVSKNRTVMQSLKDILFYGGDYWFLLVLFMVFAFYPAIYVCMYGKYSSYFITAVIVGCSVMGIFANIRVFMIGSAVYYLLPFHVGVLLKKRAFSFESLKYGWCKLLSIALIVTFMTVRMYGKSLSIEGMETAISAVIATLGVGASVFLCAFKTFKGIFFRFGAWSLQIYLLSKPVIFVVRNAIVLFFNIRMPLAVYLFNFISGFFLTYFIVKTFLYQNKWLRFLMGGGLTIHV